MANKKGGLKTLTYNKEGNPITKLRERLKNSLNILF